MDYASNLGFEQSPDFDFLKEMVQLAARENGLDIFDNVFDWTLLLTKSTKGKHSAKQDDKRPRSCASDGSHSSTSKYFVAKNRSVSFDMQI